VNPAYKHLESKLRIGEFTLLQWAGLFLGFMAAVTWGLYISPLGGRLTLVTSIYIGGVPAGAAFLASVAEIDIGLHLRALVRHRRRVGRYAPGPGSGARGYVLRADARDERDADRHLHTPDLDLNELWLT
jgi:hypothetical protein